MDLILVRHGEAAERDAKRWPDDRDRPLTPRGVKRFRAVARTYIAPRVPSGALLWSSGLKRAWQTAVLLAGEADTEAPVVCRPLEPGGAQVALLRRIKSESEAECIVVVGHEPDLGHLATHLLLGRADGTPIVFKKGGAACLRVEPAARGGHASLLWLVSPRLLLDVRR